MLDQPSAPVLKPSRFQFGPFEFRVDTGELSKAGRPTRLPPQPSRVLSLLVRRAPETVNREEIQAEIWQDGTVVEFDQGLNFCIRQIRATLGEDAKEPRFIETIPKRGYRFLAPVTPVFPEVASPPQLVAPMRDNYWPGTLLACGALILATVVWWNDRPKLPGTPEADRLFIEAEHLSDTGIPENRPKAAERYEKVTQLVPGFAPAWAAWSNLDVMMIFGGQGRNGQALKDSEIHAKKALALDNTLALAHANLAHSYWHQWKWREAEAEFQHATQLDENEPMAQHLYALFLAAVGRKEEALARAKRAVDLAPASGIVNYTLTKVYEQTGQFEAATVQAEKTLVWSRHYPAAYIVQMNAYAMLGRFDLALASLDRGVKLGPNDGNGLYRSNVFALQGRTAEARAILEAFHPPPNARRVPGQLITALAALGDLDAAFTALNVAVDDHIPGLIWIKSEPGLGPLRSDPRFRKVLDRMGNP